MAVKIPNRLRSKPSRLVILKPPFFPDNIINLLRVSYASCPGKLWTFAFAKSPGPSQHPINSNFTSIYRNVVMKPLPPVSHLFFTDATIVQMPLYIFKGTMKRTRQENITVCCQLWRIYSFDAWCHLAFMIDVAHKYYEIPEINMVINLIGCSPGVSTI